MVDQNMQIQLLKAQQMILPQEVHLFLQKSSQVPSASAG
jgi:hypothetical protein